MNPPVAVTGAFDDLRSASVRFLQESAALGGLRVLLWEDSAVLRFTGQPPKFPLSERQYLVKALRYVSEVLPVSPENLDTLPLPAPELPAIWSDLPGGHHAARQAFCRQHGMDYRVLGSAQIQGCPEWRPAASDGRKKVVVTGCYDWFHSGHVRFFEEVSAYGDLYVIVGHDANIRALKGEGHPLLPQEERRYMAGSVGYVTQALISSGNGWLDAEPEIARLKPDIYAVNEDGDRGGKREFCARRGIEYLVLKRVPAPGLPQRSSTDLRGF